MDKKEQMVIGLVGKPHGVRGEVKIIPLTDDIRRFRRLTYVLIEDKEYKVEFTKLQADRAILKLEGMNSPEDLLGLKEKPVSVHRKDAVKKKKDEYFIDELVGMAVQDEERVAWGEIFDVVQTGANDVYWIKEPKELLIPALKAVILKVDVEANLMTIRPPREWNYED